MSKPRRHITPEGFRRLAEEHERIWTVDRPRIVSEVEAAAALGDRSENAEYLYGKRRLRELDRRLRFLSERMDDLTVVDPAPHPSGRAYFGAWVVVETEGGEARTYRLVGPDEADAGRGHVSVEAPLGRALLGRREGDTVIVQRPAGPAEITVVEVRWATPPEGAAEPLLTAGTASLGGSERRAPPSPPPPPPGGAGGRGRNEGRRRRPRGPHRT
jgi:transcription elongation factor GreB